jgi:hypothetical protein
MRRRLPGCRNGCIPRTSRIRRDAFPGLLKAREKYSMMLRDGWNASIAVGNRPDNGARPGLVPVAMCAREYPTGSTGFGCHGST